MGRHRKATVLASLCGLVCLALTPADAMPPESPAAAFLETAGGERIRIGQVVFDGGAFEVNLDNTLFSEHFLSMRPFKCLEGPQIHLCHVPYPYDLPRQIEDGDLTDLEYDFLFLWKGAGEYGINMWNGVYYRLEDHGDRLVGTLHEVDMGKLAVPPDPSVRHPIRSQDLEEGDPDSHWLPRLVIE